MTGARVGLKHVSHNRPRARDHPGSGRVGQLRQYQSARWMITASARLRHEERPSGELRVLSQVSRGFGQPNLGSSRTPAGRREPLHVLVNQPWRPDLGDELRTLDPVTSPEGLTTLPGAVRPDAVALDLAQGCGVAPLLSRRGRSAGRPLARPIHRIGQETQPALSRQGQLRVR